MVCVSEMPGQVHAPFGRFLMLQSLNCDIVDFVSDCLCQSHGKVGGSFAYNFAGIYCPINLSLFNFTLPITKLATFQVNFFV